MLQRKCSKCLRWENYVDFPNKQDKEWRGKHTWCKRCVSTDTYRYQAERGAKRRVKLIMDAGGKCAICGYSKNHTALTFHHRDPLSKSFSLDTRGCSNRKWEKLIAEAKKCDLLCHNCHMEVHYPDATL